jgi:hypothetical protein
MRYIRPKSLTWWAGVGAILTGALSMALPDDLRVSEFGRLLAMLAGSGDASPAALVFLGLGLIGIRDRMERAMKEPGHD